MINSQLFLWRLLSQRVLPLTLVSSFLTSLALETNHLITCIQSEAFHVSQIHVTNNKVILLGEITSKRNYLDPTMGWHLQSLVEGSVLWAQHQCVPAGEGSPSHTRAATSLQYFLTNDRRKFKPDTMCPTTYLFCSVVSQNTELVALLELRVGSNDQSLATSVLPKHFARTTCAFSQMIALPHDW